MLHTQTLTEYLDTLASSAPTPGGGAAAAVTAAQGVALLSMVCRLTLGKKNFAAHEHEISTLLEKFEQYRQRFLTIAQQDVDIFQTVIAAYKLPKNNLTELEIRAEAIQSAIKAAAEISFALFTACEKMLPLADVLKKIGNPTVLSDVVVGRHLLFAALMSAKANLEVNLASIVASPA